MGFFSSKPKLPPPPPPPPTLDDIEKKKRQKEIEEGRRRRRGFGAGTILTSPLGVQGNAPVSRPRLLGQSGTQ